MAQLTVQKNTLDGLAPNFNAADAAGDQFENDSKTVLHIKNGHTAAQTITINSASLCNYGFGHDVVISVGAGGTIQVGPFNAARFNDTNRNVNVTYGNVTGLSVAAVSLG